MKPWMNWRMIPWDQKWWRTRISLPGSHQEALACYFGDGQTVWSGQTCGFDLISPNAIGFRYGFAWFAKREPPKRGFLNGDKSDMNDQFTKRLNPAVSLKRADFHQEKWNQWELTAEWFNLLYHDWILIHQSSINIAQHQPTLTYINMKQKLLMTVLPS
jgi:hypothetical protein